MRLAPPSGQRQTASAATASGIPLDVTTLGLVRDRLLQARLELQQAYLQLQGHPEAARNVASAGSPLRNALDVFEAAYKRGRL